MQQDSVATLRQLEVLVVAQLKKASAEQNFTDYAPISSHQANAALHDLKEAGRTLRLFQSMLVNESSDKNLDMKKNEFLEQALKIIEAASEVSLAALSLVSNKIEKATIP